MQAFKKLCHEGAQRLQLWRTVSTRHRINTTVCPGTAPFIASQAKDELNNRRLCGGDTFNVRLEGPASVEGSVEDHGDGTYTASYTACRAGPYTLSVTNGAAPLPLDTQKPAYHSQTPAAEHHACRPQSECLSRC